MSQDSERMKAMLSVKQRLEKRIEKLDNEAKELKATLDVLNGMLLEKGFKRGDIKEAAITPKEPTQTTQQTEPKKAKEEKISPYRGGEPEKDRKSVV